MPLFILALQLEQGLSSKHFMSLLVRRSKGCGGSGHRRWAGSAGGGGGGEGGEDHWLLCASVSTSVGWE